MFSPRNALLAIPLTALLAACGGSSNNDGDGLVGSDPTGDLRLIHAVADAPAVDVSASTGGSTTTPVTALDFAATTGYLTLPATTYDFAVLANLPGGATQNVLDVPAQAIDEGQAGTAVVIGTVDDGDSYDLDVMTFDPPAVGPGAGEVSIVAAHASTAADAAASSGVDVYVTATEVDVSTAAPTFTFGYTETVDTSAAVGALTAQTYYIQITPAGSNTVVYNSGPVDLSAFAGANIAVIAVNTTNQVQQDAAPVKLLAVVGGTVVELLDADTEAAAKTAHVSPDAGDVDVTVDNAVVYASVAYLDVALDAATYDTLPAGTYDLNVQAAGTGTDVLSQDVSATLEAGTEYTVLALGNAADIGTAPATAFDLTPTVDDNRAVATQASVKVVHGAPGVGNVDVYVTAAGTVSVADIEGGAGGTPLLSDFAFREITDYVAVAPGDYDIRIADPTTDNVLINVEGQTLAAGAVVTAIARQADEVDGTPSTAGLLLLTN